MRVETLVFTLLLAGSACSLMGPSDSELMGAANRVEPSGGDASVGGAAPSGGSPGSGAADSAPGASGRGAESGLGGNAGSDEGAGGSAGVSGAAGAAGDSARPGGAGPGSTSVAGLLLWLRGDAGVVEDGTAITAWEDASGRANHATQSVAAARPKSVQLSATALPMVSFDGVDDYLKLPAGFADFDSGLTFFAVMQESSGTGCPSVLQLSNGSEIDDIDFGLDTIRSEALCGDAGCRAADEGMSGGSSRTSHYEVGSLWLAGAAGVLSAAATNVLAVVHRTDQTLELRINGVALPGAGIPLPEARSRVSNSLGRSLYASCQPFRGRVGELLLYARSLSDAERDSVESYLTARWR